MKNKIITLMLLTCIGATTLTGCSNPFVRTKEAKAYTLESVNDESMLEDGVIYVKSGKDYTKLYSLNGNFTVGDTNSSTDASRVLWFKDDLLKIPTMYKGDKLVCKYSDTFNETVTMERFEDLGYTLGMCNLSKLASGRYSLSLATDDRSIEPDSDVSALYDLAKDSVIVDKIGEDELREANISRCGTITNLKQDKTYKTYIYAGSKEYIYNLKADVRVFGSMEIYSVVDYDFYNGTMISINMPDYFNSGYYYINGVGLVRYVNESKKDAPDIDDIDFNVPTTVPEERTEDSSELTASDFAENPEDNTKVYSLDIKNTGHYSLTIQYGELPDGVDNGEGIPNISAKVVSSEGIYELQDIGNNTLSVEFDATAGSDYSLTVENIYGRTIDVKSNATNAANTEEGE